MTSEPPEMPPSYGDGIAVVAVTYSPGSTLETFLDSLAAATTRPVRTVLADNGSVDGAPERAASRAGVRLLPMGENLGYGSAANRAVADLDGDIGWVVVVNPDIEWRPGSLDELLAAARRWPRAGSLGPLIREPDGTVYPSARLLPSLGRGMAHAVLGQMWPTNPWSTSYRQADAAIGERTVGWLSGSCLLLRRAAFDSVHGFDSRYFMYFEDVDLAERLGRAGWLNVYVPSAEVTHLGGHATGASGATSARMLREHHRSTYRYLADHYRGARWAPLRAGLRAGLSARSAVLARSAARPRH